MGHKKRNPVSRSKSSAPSSVAAVGEALVFPNSDERDTVVSAELQQNSISDIYVRNELVVVGSDLRTPKSSSFDVTVKNECERALTFMRKNSHRKALKLMKELTCKYENSPNSALVHRVQGTVLVKMASVIDDPKEKQRHLKKAIESARKAVALSPDSIEFGHFYANILYEAANEAKEYDEVLRECERALAIENPIDPSTESLVDDSQQKLSTADERIANVQSELRSLIQKSNIASISTWVNNFGNGDEKFRLIPIRRALEDPMERLVQTRRPNEIKKATKTSEERRKEIEVRVTAARLMQQKSESPFAQGDADKGLDSNTRSGQKVGERRKGGSARKGASSAERKDSVRSFWTSMNSDVKKEFLKISISELKTHFSSSKDRLAYEVISEAVAYAEENRDWNYWVCCRCSEKFVDRESLMQHVQEHLATLLPNMQSLVPKTVDDEWAEMLLNCNWKPIDVNAIITIVREQLKFLDSHSKFLDESYPNDGPEDNGYFADTYCKEDEWYSSPKKKESGVYCNGSTLSREYDKVSDIVWMDCDENLDIKSIMPNEDWPLSDDAENGKLIERIHMVFQALIKNRCLASSHLHKVMNFTVEELQRLAYGSQLLKYKVDQTPICVCFLGVTSLKKILKFLQDLSHACGLGRYPDINNSSDNVNIPAQWVKAHEKIVLSQDASYLSLHEHFLLRNCTPSSCHVTVTNDSSLGSSHNPVSENGALLDSDALLSWIFQGPSSVEQLDHWVQAREEKSQQGTEILQLLEKELYNLQVLCERKLEHLSYEEALHGVEDLCLEEGKKREVITEFGCRSYESVLKKRREELIESHNENMVISNRFELDVISNVLKEAESLNVDRFGFEKYYGGMTTNTSNLESGEDDGWRAKDYLHQADSFVEVAVQRQKEQVSIELSKIDARILHIVGIMQQLEVKLESASLYDYQSILIPLVKSYMRAHLEDLAEKDATEKSDAAREALMAELALDSKRSTNGGGSENTKHIPEKSKDMKRNKEFQKNKELKSNNENEFHPETNEEDSFPSMHEDKHLDSQVITYGGGDSVNQLEEDSRCRIVLEAEERKLEETLEFQRLVENEAKKKHLAEQQKKTGKLDVEILSAAALSNDELVIGQGKYNDINMEPMVQKNGGFGKGKGFYERTFDLAAEGEATGASSGNGVLASHRRPGRRNRRQKVPAKSSDGNNHTSIDKDIEAGQPICTEGLTDNGSKTLRQLQAEEVEEERFQADLKKAVCQSLDSFHTCQELPVLSKIGMSQRDFEKVGDLAVAHNEIVVEHSNEFDVCGTGLKNEIGEYNCFLNVIIQSLWHLRCFRNEFLRKSPLEHAHVGDPCVVCALFYIFTALNTAAVDACKEAVAPTSLRTALSNLYPDSNFFQEGQMNDASEVLGVLFDCLHQSFTSASCVSDAESVDSNCLGSWDCSSSTCIVHSFFGMDVFEQMNCYNCRLESRHLKYTSFFHNINASALRTMKVMCPESSFDELLNLVEMNHQLACDPEAGGCGKPNYIHHILSNPPHVFIIVLGWQYTRENVDSITATLNVLSVEMDVSNIYRGLDPKNRHSLVSMVCYYGQHYHCFAYSHDHERWMMYDDKTVKVIGSWKDVLDMCIRGHLQPQVLFFEAVSS